MEPPVPDSQPGSVHDPGLMGGASRRYNPGPPPSLDEVQSVQSVLPEFEIVRFLGRGGMGSVYQARHRSLDRGVALKILSTPGPAGGGAPTLLERFQQEARTLARLRHPGIVEVFDSGQTATGQPYIVMEFVEGTDLAQAIRTAGRLEPEWARSVIERVCDVLEYAHAQGVIHRDIKPGNIIVGRDRTIKVADFGLAKVESGAAERALTGSNVALGTADYAAPEVLAPGGPPDCRADLYSVGVMLYQLLTGEVPRGLFKMPSQKVPGLDPRFDGIVCRAMEPDPADRYPSASELRADLVALGSRPATDPMLDAVQPGAGRPSTASARRTFPSLPPVLSRGRFLLGPGVAVAMVIVAVLALRPPVAVVPALSGNAVVAEERDWVPAPDPDAGWRSLLAGLPSRPQGMAEEWRRERGELRTSIANATSHQTLELPAPGLPLNYDLRLRLTRHDGQGAVVVGFRRGEVGGFVMFDTFIGVRRFYETYVGMCRNELAGSVARYDGLRLDVGRRHEILVQVREDRVTGGVDGQELVRWGADWTRIAQAEPWFFPDQLEGRPILGIGACCTDITFHGIDWRAAPPAESP